VQAIAFPALATWTAPQGQRLVLAVCQCVDTPGKMPNMLTTLMDMTEPARVEPLAMASHVMKPSPIQPRQLKVRQRDGPRRCVSTLRS
jgi:hypothetical protein